MKSIAWLVLAVFYSVLGSGISLADSVDEYVKHEMSAKRIPAMSIVVLKDGKVIKQRAYGVVNVEHAVPAALTDVYPVASITKLFTATAVFLLVQENKLQLNQKIVDLLPGLPNAWKEVTVLNCLSHTSGIPDYPGVYDSPSPPLTGEDALKMASAKPMAYLTGDQSVYNQTEYLILEMVIEKESGMPLEEFLARRIFVPLGMQSARFGDSRDVFPNGVTLYTRAIPAQDRFHSIPLKPFVNHKDDPLFHSELLFLPYSHASAGLNMTSSDLAKFDAALRRGSLLNQATLQQMWAPFRLNNGEVGDFTAGWQYADLNGHKIVSHIGAGMAQYSTLVDDHLTLILLTNVQETRVRDLSIGILGLYVPAIAKP